MSKEKVFEEAEKLIRLHGVEGLTIRKIAELAGTNVASVNYYYGSKEKLVNEVLKKQFEALSKCFKILDDRDSDPFDRLKSFFFLYASILAEYPDLAKRVFYQENLFDSQKEYIEFVKSQGFEKLVDAIIEIVGEENTDKAMHMIPQMFAAILFPEILGNKIFRDALPLEQSVELFLTHYFYQYNPVE